MVHQAGWLDIFPYNTLLDSDALQPLLVDVGGNVGHDIEPSGSPIPTQPPACTSKTGLKWCSTRYVPTKVSPTLSYQKKETKIMNL